MIIAAWNETGIEDIDIQHKTQITGRREVLDIRWPNISVHHQVKIAGVWMHSNGGYKSLCINKHLGWGYEYLGKYDGRHHLFSIGPIHFAWSD